MKIADIYNVTRPPAADYFRHFMERLFPRAMLMPRHCLPLMPMLLPPRFARRRHFY